MYPFLPAWEACALEVGRFSRRTQYKGLEWRSLRKTCLPPAALCVEKPGGSGMLEVFFGRDGGGLFSSTAHRGGGGGGEVCFSRAITAELWQ